MYVSYPRFFEGQSETDGRLKWYGTTTTKDVIMTARVRALRFELMHLSVQRAVTIFHVYQQQLNTQVSILH